MPVSLQGDSRWTVRTVLSMIHSRSADLHPFATEVEKSGFYLTECIGPGFARQFPLTSLQQCAGGRLYAFNPIAVPVLAVPFVMAVETGIRVAQPLLRPLAERFQNSMLHAFFQGDAISSTPIYEILISSLFTAAAVTALYLAAVELLPTSLALALALIFAFGTLLWSLVSRALWQHSPSVFLNSLLVLILIRGDYRRRFCIAMGFILALAYFVRPTNAVPVVVICAYLLVRIRWNALWVLPGALIPTAFFVAMNLDMYGSILAPFFQPVSSNMNNLSLHPEVGLGLISNLISPNRGLFVFMPFFLLLLVPGVWREPMPDVLRRVRPWFCALIAIHMLMVSAHTDWWGGFSYGPRYLADVLPYLMILWSPALLWVGRNRPRQAVLAVTLAIAFLIQLRGATSIKVHDWNSTPVNVNANTARIWDWRDLQFMR